MGIFWFGIGWDLLGMDQLQGFVPLPCCFVLTYILILLHSIRRLGYTLTLLELPRILLDELRVCFDGLEALV